MSEGRMRPARALRVLLEKGLSPAKWEDLSFRLAGEHCDCFDCEVCAVRILTEYVADVRVQNMEFSTLPSNLVSSEEVSQAIKGLLSAERIDELAEAGYMPCWVIDGCESLYRVADVKKYIARSMAKIQTGAPFPDVISVPAPERPESLLNLPEALVLIGEHLKVVQVAVHEPGVYFLVKKRMVIYVGQSVNVPARISTHASSDLRFDRCFVLPVPKPELDRVEASFIQILRPARNGRHSNGMLTLPMRLKEGEAEGVLEAYGVPRDKVSRLAQCPEELEEHLTKVAKIRVGRKRE